MSRGLGRFWQVNIFCMPNRGAAPAGAAKGQQRQLSVRDRQFIAAIRREAAAIEKETPGAIHALHFDSGGKNVHCSVVFNRNRVEGGGAQRGRDDHDSSKREGQHDQQQRATKPNAAGQASQSGQRAPPRDQPRQPSGDGRTKQRGKERATPSPARPANPNPPSGGAGRGDSGTTPEDPRLSKERVAALAKAIKGHITQVVRSMGGDETTGGDYLNPRQVIAVGAHKATFRLPKGSPAADIPANELGAMLETSLYGGGDPAALEDYLTLYLNPENMSIDSSTSLADRASSRETTRSPWSGG